LLSAPGRMPNADASHRVCATAGCTIPAAATAHTVNRAIGPSVRTSWRCAGVRLRGCDCGAFSILADSTRPPVRLQALRLRNTTPRTLAGAARHPDRWGATGHASGSRKRPTQSQARPQLKSPVLIEEQHDGVDHLLTMHRPTGRHPVARAAFRAVIRVHLNWIHRLLMVSLATNLPLPGTTRRPVEFRLAMTFLAVS